ncbi:MAG TPA: acylneuraminate cytidylyltransferase family protein [Flavobacteriales bacterium]|nr:acylneuraminate cytidylyltransferase family protein [Flavobacteriales bacterium]
MKKLFLIPARGGSKGLPRKNVLPLAGRPMIEYTLDAALGAMEEGDEICVSTDDTEIIQVVQNYGVNIPFVRPSELSNDTAGSEEVICHALDWYENRDFDFEVIVLLQVTSPLRNAHHVKEALELWSNDVDMIVSVKETDSNPYYVLFEEDEKGFLLKSKEGNFTRRQDCPNVYELNGAIYLINAVRFRENGLKELCRKQKYLMDKRTSLDVDDSIDFKIAENLITNRNTLT